MLVSIFMFMDSILLLKPLLVLVQKPFDVISPRVQKLLFRLQRYSFSCTHVLGKQLCVAHALSRSLLPIDPVIFADIDNIPLLVSVIAHASQSKLDEIRTTTL